MSPILDLRDSSSFGASIQSEDKVRRKQALEEAERTIFDSDRGWTQQDVSEVWETLERHLVRSLTDSAEYNRNLTVELWKKFLDVLPVKERNIVRLIPILTRRLSFRELAEPSEEVRLNYVSLLRLVVRKYKEHLPAHTDDIVAVLVRTVTDNYPEIKRESCRCIEELASAVPAQFYPRSESLVKPILGNFTHQHYKVRVAAVEAIGRVLLYGNSKSMEEVSTPLAQRLFDQSGAVRLAVVDVAGRWFVDLRDRYSWWYKLIPLLLTGLHDEIPKIRSRAEELWDEAGKLYMKENENDERLKDKIDFLNDERRYSVKRPNLGCRTIVQQNLCRVLGGVVRELGDWLADVRVRSAQLLCVLVLNAEQDATQHLEKILPAMYRACNDEDPRVAQNVELAAEHIGFFVDPAIFRSLVLPTLEEKITAGHLRVLAAMLRNCESGDPRFERGAIVEFLRQPRVCRSRDPNYQRQLFACCESLLKNWDTENSRSIVEGLYAVIFALCAMWREEASIGDVTRLFRSPPFVGGETGSTNAHVAHLDSILKPLEDSCRAWTIHSDEFLIFSACLSRFPAAAECKFRLVLPILRTTTGTEADPELRLKVFILLTEFLEDAKARRATDDGTGLCSEINDDTEVDIRAGHDEFLIFSACLSRFPAAAECKFRLVLPILRTTTGAEADPELRLKVFILLTEFLEDAKARRATDDGTGLCSEINDDTEVFGPALVEILRDVVKPALVWSAGRTAEAIRTAAVCCLCSLVERKTPEGSNDERRVDVENGVDGSMDEIVPLLVTLVDDNSKKTRLHALRAIRHLAERSTCVVSSRSEERVHATYPAVLKRLDDGCDDVRVAGVEALVAVWRSLPKNYDLVFAGSHVDYLYTTTIVHLDDPDPKFRRLMLDALLELAKIHPRLLETKLQRCKENFRNREGLDVLLNNCHDLLRSRE